MDVDMMVSARRSRKLGQSMWGVTLHILPPAAPATPEQVSAFLDAFEGITAKHKD